jgi:hypothetical protein
MSQHTLMRAVLNEREVDIIQFSFDGALFNARAGQSVAAALISAGERCLRIDEEGNPKGALCGIGVCWECRCSIDGVTNTRACITPVAAGMVVLRQVGV